MLLVTVTAPDGDLHALRLAIPLDRTRALLRRYATAATAVGALTALCLSPCRAPSSSGSVGASRASASTWPGSAAATSPARPARPTPWATDSPRCAT